MIGPIAASMRRRYTEHSTAFEDLEYVTMGNGSELAFDFADAFTCAGWFKTTAGGVLLSKAKTPGDSFFEGYTMFIGASGKMAVRLEGGTTNNNKIQATTQLGGLLDGTWHHYAFTYDGSSTLAGLTIYIDDAAQAVESTTDAASGSMLTTHPFTVGRGPGNPGGGIFYSPGARFAEVGVWNIELTAGEMADVYSAKIPPDLRELDTAANLVGYWRMGEGASFPTIPDLSGNGNDGTMTNMEAGDIVGDAPGL